MQAFCLIFCEGYAPMESIETTGETVEEAIATGLAQLAATPSDVIVEVLEEASRGMFGQEAHLARVRLQLIRKPAAPPAPTAIESISIPHEDYLDEEDEIGYEEEFSEGETTEDDASVGKAVLTTLLDKMGFKAKISVRRAEAQQNETAPWILDVNGAHMNVLIGRRGETLAALQYITRLIASRQLQRRANIVVDVGGYKVRRSQRLRELAIRMADQAVRQNRTVTLEPMPPNERRIVHIALRSRDDVFTKSVGDGDSRKVTIVPK
jgi:spoIIIJ-associated protein